MKQLYMVIPGVWLASVNISSQGSGDFDNYKITIYKVEKDNNTKTLAGATFKLQRFVDGKPQDVLDKDNNIVTNYNRYYRKSYSGGT